MGAQVAVAEDDSALFYNPGALVRAKRLFVSAGFTSTQPHLEIQRDYDKPEQREISNQMPPDFHGFHMGALFPLGGVFGNRLAVGFSGYLPTHNLTRGQSLDARQPQFYRYQSLPDHDVALFSLAGEPIKGLGLGLGLQSLGDLRGDVAMSLHAADSHIEQGSVEVNFEPTVALTAGIWWRPLEGLDLGFSWRGPLQSEFELPTQVLVDDLLEMNIMLKGTVLYTPHIFSLGGAWNFKALNLLISSELSYALWSQAPDPSPHFSFDIEGALAEDLGFDERMDVGSGAPIELAFRDIFLWKLGFEQHLLDRLHLRTSYSYRPSPAPVPTRSFNYIDSDAHILGLGFGLIFPDPLEIRRNPVRLDLSYQASFMEEMQVVKAEGEQDLVGGYTTGGRVDAFAITFVHEL